jgi:hypothetical protein
MKIANCNLAALAELMGPDADELDAVSLREFLDGIVVDTEELDEAAWNECLSGAAMDVLRLDPVGLDAGILTVMRGGTGSRDRPNGTPVCTLDPENYPRGIGQRIQPHYDALVRWAESRGLLE